MNIRGKEDPNLKVGQVNDRASKSTEDYVWALRDIDFEVKQGEVLGIIGKNGAGKSTLLKILSRVTSPTTGRITAYGRIASLLEVGTGFHPEMTGRENIYMNGSIMGMNKAEITRKLDEIVDFAGIEKYIDTPTKRYSSGMTVRLGFSIAAHLEPEILVVDEVLAVGDAEFQKKAIGKMKDVSQGEGRTVLFVSHNMASVKSLCTTGLILNNGMISYSGTADDAVSEYLKGESANSDIALRERTDRVGNGKLRFVDVKIRDEKDNLVTNVISGEMVKLELHYEMKAPIVEQKVILGLNFKNDIDDIVLSFVSDEMDVQVSNLQSCGLIKLEIANLYLRGQDYKIRLLSFEGSTSINDALDIVENAAVVSVLPGDIWKTGKINRSGYNSVLPATYSFG
jgi:lipopolysaccharide transport system ATP-binding protein